MLSVVETSRRSRMLVHGTHLPLAAQHLNNRNTLSRGIRKIRRVEEKLAEKKKEKTGGFTFRQKPPEYSYL